MMKEAFEKAGMSPGMIAFAAACHDLARLALNKQPDPARAAHAWLGMASGQMFREGPLKEFLSAVAEERAAGNGSAGASDHDLSDTHSGRVTPPADPNSGDERGRVPTDTHTARVSSPPEFSRERGGHQSDYTRSALAPSLAHREPTAMQNAATRRARELAAAVMSGVYIPDHSGGKELFDDIRIRYYNMTEERLARAVGRNSVAYNLVRIAKMRLPANHEQMPSNTTSKEIFSVDEIRRMQREAAVFAGHGLISLPEELRAAVAEAVEAA